MRDEDEVVRRPLELDDERPQPHDEVHVALAPQPGPAVVQAVARARGLLGRVARGDLGAREAR